MTIMSQYDVGINRNKKKTISLYLTWAEKKNIIKELNSTALYLLEFYLSKIVWSSYIIDDKKTAAATGLSLRSVKDTRRQLIRHNLYYQCKTTNRDTTIYLYCALKEGVYCKKYFGHLFGYNSILEVKKNHTVTAINAILANACLTTMEINDIKTLLS